MESRSSHSAPETKRSDIDSIDSAPAMATTRHSEVGHATARSEVSVTSDASTGAWFVEVARKVNFIVVSGCCTYGEASEMM